MSMTFNFALTSWAKSVSCIRLCNCFSTLNVCHLHVMVFFCTLLLCSKTHVTDCSITSTWGSTHTDTRRCTHFIKWRYNLEPYLVRENMNDTIGTPFFRVVNKVLCMHILRWYRGHKHKIIKVLYYIFTFKSGKYRVSVWIDSTIVNLKMFFYFILIYWILFVKRGKAITISTIHNI